MAEASQATGIASKTCLNCHYGVPVGVDVCPECGLSQAQQQQACVRRGRLKQIGRVLILLVAATTGPITLSMLFAIAGYRWLEVLFGVLQFMVLPVIALLWGCLLDGLDTRGHWAGKLSLGIVLAVPTTLFAALAIEVIVIAIVGGP